MWLMLASVTFGAALYLVFELWTVFIILATVILVRIYEAVYDRRT